MSNNNLNLRCTILHMFEGIQYKISGTLLAVNESDETCTIKFDNKRVEDNIPMKDVYINEGMIDAIKKAGKKVMGWIASKVKGLIAFADPDGKYSLNSFLNPFGMLVCQSTGKNPAAVKFYPSEQLIESASEQGVTVNALDFDDFCKESCEKEIEEINEYWHRVMKEVGTSNKTVAESIAFVNDKYYKDGNMFKSLTENIKTLMNKELYEGHDSLNPTPIFNVDQEKDIYGNTNYGVIVNSKELKNHILNSISSQLSISDKKLILKYSNYDELTDKQKRHLERALKEVNKYKKRHPLIIWGAPGIGKTNIVKDVINSIRKDPGMLKINLNILEVNCGKMSKDDFTLPMPREIRYKNGRAEMVLQNMETAPLTWMPVYRLGSPEQNLWWENFYAHNCHKVVLPTEGDLNYMVDEEGREYNGGIIFFDELARMDGDCFNKMMGISDGILDSFVIAKSWGLIAASNRTEDDPNLNVEATTQNAFTTRWEHVMYVPSMNDWLEWAKNVGEYGTQNIDPAILDFINAGGESLWYGAVMYGSFDREVKEWMAKSKKAPEKYKNLSYDNIHSFVIGDPNAAKELYKSLMSDKENSFMFNTKMGWNGRTWQVISDKYYEMLRNIFIDADDGWTFDDIVDMSIEDYGYHGVHHNVLVLALEHLPEECWEKAFMRYLGQTPFTNVDGEVLAYQYRPDMTAEEKAGYINDMLVHIVGLEVGSMNAKPTLDMVKYNKWRNMFSRKDVIDSIYKTGYMPKDLMAQDNLMYNEKGAFEWKKDTKNMDDVYDFILSQYPGGAATADKDFKKFVKYISAGVQKVAGTLQSMMFAENKSSQKEIDKAITSSFPLNPKMPALDDKKLHEYFTVKCHSKQYKDGLLFDLKKYPANVRAILYTMYTSFSFYRYMLNYVRYMCKTQTSAVSGHIGKFGNDSEDSLKKMIIRNCHLDDATVKKYQSTMQIVDRLKHDNNATNNPSITAILSICDIFTYMKMCLEYFSATMEPQDLFGHK